MKKLIVFSLLFLLILSFCACGNNTAPSKEDEELFNNGFVINISTEKDGKLLVLLSNEDQTEFRKLEYDCTEEQYDDFMNIDIFSDDYEEQRIDFLKNLSEPKIENCTDKKPSQEDLSYYVGKTVQSLIDDGFELQGYGNTDDSALFTMTNSVYQISIECKDASDVFDENGEPIEEEVCMLEIHSIHFDCFDLGILSE